MWYLASEPGKSEEVERESPLWAIQHTECSSLLSTGLLCERQVAEVTMLEAEASHSLNTHPTLRLPLPLPSR